MNVSHFEEELARLNGEVPEMSVKDRIIYLQRKNHEYSSQLDNYNFITVDDDLAWDNVKKELETLIVEHNLELLGL